MENPPAPAPATPPATPPAAAPPATPPAAAPPAAPATVPIAAAPATPPAPAATPTAPATTPAAPATPAADATDPNAALLARINALEISNRNNLVARIAAENGIAAEAAEFLTAPDEAGLIAQAQKIKGFAPATAPAGGQQQAPPPAAGTNTQPQTPATPTLDEQIADAEKKGDRFGSMRLKLQKISG